MSVTGLLLVILGKLLVALVAWGLAALLLRQLEGGRWARAVYAAVARAAWSDGVITRRERRALDAIARALGLPRVEAWWVEMAAARA